jgi:hypothetical protein
MCSRLGLLAVAALVPSILAAEPSSTCIGQPDGTSCDDGNSCTTDEACWSGSCIVGAQFSQSAGSPISVAAHPIKVVVEDVNLDGNDDLIVLNYSSHELTVLLGNGAGGFSPAAGSPVFTGLNAEQSLTTADFNGDGKVDVAIVNNNGVSVFLGNGLGGFAAAPGTPTLAGLDTVAIAAGDFNLDGKTDVVTSDLNVGTVHVLLGNGLGGFTEAAGSPVAAGGGPGLVVGDFNLDGKPDIAVANQYSRSVVILLGNGAGGFSPAPGSPIPTDTAFQLAIGDVNLDGKPDIISASQLNVTLLLGDGSGAFTTKLLLAAPVINNATGDFVGASVGDFNRDGKPDVAVLNYWTTEIAVLIGDGSGGFVEVHGASFGGVSTPQSSAVGDFNRDGAQDLVVANFLSDTLTVFLNATGVAPDGTPCGGGCTADGTCESGACRGASVSCDDGNPCTDDACDPVSGCVHTNNTAPCSDGNACTVGDACSGGACVPGAPASCDDGNCCTIDSCDPSTGCVHAPNPTTPVFTTQPSFGDVVLWPPGHGYVDFTLADTGAAASSACGIGSIAFASCASSQPENASGTGDGNSLRDCVYEPGALHVRAERDGACSPIGRLYTTTLVAVDACGHTSLSNPAAIPVWHDRNHAPAGSPRSSSGNTNDVRSGTNGTYGTDCGAGGPQANGTSADSSDADPEMEIIQQAAVTVDTLRVDRGADGSLLLTWMPPAQNGQVTRYHVWKLDPLTLFWMQIAEVSRATTSWTEPADGSSWLYKVSAVIK